MTVVLDPRNLDWDLWCARTSELFAANQLGTIPESQWRIWADAVSGIGYFEQNGVPDSRNFNTWQDWAFALTNSMVLKR